MKGGLAFHGKPTREYLCKEDSASPAATLKSICLICIIDTHEKQDIMVWTHQM